MFDKREVLTYQNIDVKAITPQVVDYWTRCGYYVTQVSPTTLAGTGYSEEYGIRPQFNLNMTTQGNITTFDLSTKGEVSSTAIIILILLVVFLWPVALILGIVGYTKHDGNAKATMYNFWGFINSLSNQQGMPPMGYYTPPPPGTYQQQAPQGQPPPQ